jgi:glycosyltransferase involved in cell wall biosynthesis
MRVAVDVTTLHDHRSGIRVVAEQLLPRLAARPGVELVAYSASWRGRADVRALVDELVGGVRVVGRPMAAQPLRQAWRRVDWPPIEWWTGPVDVVFGLNFVVPPTRRAGRVALVHDLTAWRFPELCTADTLQYPGLIDRAIAGGAHVVTPTQAVADEVTARLGASPDRVHAVHWAPRPMGGGSGPSGGRRGRYVLALGTIEPRKDHPTLLRAFDRAAATDPDLELVVVGAPGWGVGAFESTLAAVTHRDRVTWLPAADDTTIADLLARAAVFAYPSIYEGFGLPPLEAMAAGVPVVASAIPALEEVLADAAVLVPVGDVDALATALLDATGGDPALRTARVMAGRARAARFSWDAAADGVLAAFEQAATVRGS